jgi:hypothetical protein
MFRFENLLSRLRNGMKGLELSGNKGECACLIEDCRWHNLPIPEWVSWDNPLFRPRRILSLADLCAVPHGEGFSNNVDLVAVVAYIDASSRPRQFFLLDESLCVVVLKEGRARVPEWVTEGDTVCVSDARFMVCSV